MQRKRKQKWEICSDAFKRSNFNFYAKWNN
nr:MAG TPA: hypothetical protein [Caudoviricetes sp.]